MFYYLAIFRRGGECGHPRKPLQTPYEYDNTLQTGRGDQNLVSGDINGLTKQFILAHYSQHEVTLGQEVTARLSWERICKTIRKTRRLD